MPEFDATVVCKDVPGVPDFRMPPVKADGLTARCRAALASGWTGTAADLAALVGVNSPHKVAHVLGWLEVRGEVRKLGKTATVPGRPFDKGLRVWAAV